MIRTVQKSPLVGSYEGSSGVAQHQRRHSCFILDPLAVVEMDVAIDHPLGFINRGRLMPVNVLRLQDSEEIFSKALS